MGTVVTEAATGLFESIKQGILEACPWVIEHLHDHTNYQALIEEMKNAMNPRMAEFLQGIGNDIIALDLMALRQEILTSSQGVYAGIIRKQSDEVFRYVRSSYGRGGIRYRIFKNHLSKSYQSKHSQKALYCAMNEVGATVSFIRLATYKQTVSPGQILLTEAVCCILFGSFDTWEYREIRPSSLPPVNWAGGLNRSDPLRIPGMSNQVGTDVTTYRRLKRLQNCLDFGLTRVVPYTKNYGSTSWRFPCFNERLTIPVEVVMEWGLNDGKPFEVNVRWEVANDTHQHAFAAMAEESDDGRRVGIQVSKNIRNHWVHHWIVRNIPSAVPLANTLHDFLTGKIVEKNYTWLPSRKYIFGTAHRKSGVDGEVEKANTPKGNNALELTYRGSFIWSDPKRLVETKTGNMMAKDLDCSKAMVAVDVEQNDAAGTSEGCNRCYEHEYDECDWCDECGPTAKVDNWLHELLDEHHQLLRQQGCLTYTGRILDDYPLQDSDDNI